MSPPPPRCCGCPRVGLPCLWLPWASGGSAGMGELCPGFCGVAYLTQAKEGRTELVETALGFFQTHPTPSTPPREEPPPPFPTDWKWKGCFEASLPPSPGRPQWESVLLGPACTFTAPLWVGGLGGGCLRGQRPPAQATFPAQVGVCLPAPEAEVERLQRSEWGCPHTEGPQGLPQVAPASSLPLPTWLLCSLQKGCSPTPKIRAYPHHHRRVGNCYGSWWEAPPWDAGQLLTSELGVRPGWGGSCVLALSACSLWGSPELLRPCWAGGCYGHHGGLAH